jgi:alkanesulfonate monooxygenase SsuD/methylene tetrahydromethanopterin reductase-like flavin-dependent oxidoreductase (luciferase family)
VKFGTFFLSGSPERDDAAAVLGRLDEYIVLSEELGYDSVWFAEHHFSNYGYIPNPLLLAVRAAALTERVRIGTAVLVLPFWHPLRVAEDIALTDHLTGGRLEVGVARGYQPFEFRRFGLTFDDARERTDEALEILLRALTGEPFEWSGKHFEIPETTVLPSPLQQPRPPIWLAAHTSESFEIAARFGLYGFTTNSGRPLAALEEGWNAYQDALARHPGAPRVLGVQAQICVAPTDEEAAAQAEHFLYQTRQATALRSGHEQVVSGVSAPIAFEGEASLEAVFEERTLSGNPDTVARKLEAYTRIADIDQLNCVFQVGSMDPKLVRQSMTLFAAEVAPRFR